MVIIVGCPCLWHCVHDTKSPHLPEIVFSRIRFQGHLRAFGVFFRWPLCREVMATTFYDGKTEENMNLLPDWLSLWRSALVFVSVRFHAAAFTPVISSQMPVSSTCESCFDGRQLFMMSDMYWDVCVCVNIANRLKEGKY